MPEKYSQWRASLALARASLTATLRSPTSVVFALAFPIIFVTVFGTMVDSSAVRINLALTPNSDTSGQVYAAVKAIPLIQLSAARDSLAAIDELKKGRVDGMLYLGAVRSGLPHYEMRLISSGATAERLPLIMAVLRSAVGRMDQPSHTQAVRLQTVDIPGRVYRRIDFILPGQLGFSLLMAGVFGSAFLLFNLRHLLVLRRMHATPIRSSYILLGEMVSQLLFQVICFGVITTLGVVAFRFTLVDGLWTFLEMLALTVPALIIFTGTGFAISGRIRNESSIAPIANLITVPQILLCGLFFPVDSYPSWLQHFCQLLPLTIFVDGLRRIAFEGDHIWQLPMTLAGLFAWALVVGALAARSLRWE